MTTIQRELHTSPQPARDHLTRTLSAILAAVLQVDEVPSGSDFFDDLGADSMTMARFCARVRKAGDLPAVAMRDVYEHSSIDALVGALAPHEASPEAAGDGAVQQARERFTGILAEALKVDDVSSGSDFFDDLGADSMTMARFCARVRKAGDLPAVAMRDVYEHSSIDALVEAFVIPASAEATASVAPSAAPSESPPPAVSPSPDSSSPPALSSAGNTAYVLCGAAQLIFGLAYSSLILVLVVLAYEWVAVGEGWASLFERSLIAGIILFFIPIVLPIIVKWLLVGRWRSREIRIWSLQYLRFWIVRTLVRMNPIVLFFLGSPLYSCYLRLLGARVGPGVVIFSRSIPVCTDLLTIDAGAVIHKDALLACYRAEDGLIQTGRVTIGARAFVGVQAVLDIDTEMGRDSQLGHASSLHRGQRIPEGQAWDGSPARPTRANYRVVPDGRPRRLRRFFYSIVQLVGIAVFVPLFFAIVDVLLNTPQFASLLHPELTYAHNVTFYAVAAAATVGFMIVALCLGLLVICTVPRLLNRFVPADRDVLLYGPRYVAHQMIGRMTNIPAMGMLFGDSSYVTTYVRALGYRLGTVVQTGSNFGQAFKHDNPFLCAVGTGTMIADGLSFVNATYSSTAFRLSGASIGARSFLGNYIVYPSGSRADDDVLLATKVMVPTDGPLRQHTGLLGAPSVRIPRTVRRDTDLAIGRGETRRRLHRKNRHNIVTMLMHLFARWVIGYVAIVGFVVAADFYPSLGLVVVLTLPAALLFITMAYWIAIDRLCFRMLLLAPRGCSIYDHAFWDHERYWKVPSPYYRMLAHGTPFMGLLLRLAGCHVGRRLFDDGVIMSERPFVTIGDDCTFNAGTSVQAHSQEDGAFKSDRIVIGSRCTLGVASVVHYGTTVGDHTTLMANSFLMKGEEIPDGEQWAGNPAQPVPATASRDAEG